MPRVASANRYVITARAIKEIQALLDKLPDDCSLEDVQYHLHHIENVLRGIQAANDHGSMPQGEAERRLAKWISE
ncbi:MAG TPA: hypothetical protein PKK10_03480 [Woeseiaceae bacterium]|nr:hypothetical protein [Woeseiaceae bacterium]